MAQKKPSIKLSIFFILGLFYFLINPHNAHAITLQRPAYIQDVTTSSAYVLWKTDTQASCEVKWGTTTSYGQTATGAQGRKTVDNSPGFLCNVKITGLSPNTIYYYQAVSAGTGLTPVGDQSYHIKTAPTGDTPFTYASIGDPGDCSTGQQQLRDKLIQKNPDFVLIPGDIIYNYGDGVSSSSEGEQDACLFDMYAQLMKNTPFYPTVGNHDTAGTPAFVDETQLPQGGKAAGNSTFSFNWGNHLFVALNSNSSVSYNSTSPQSSAAQMVWAYNTLAGSNQKWKILFWHHNCWSRGSHSTGTAMVNGPCRMATDLGVDVGIWGHSHAHEELVFSPNNRTRFYTSGNGGHDSTSPSCGAFSGGPTSVHCSRGEIGGIYAQVNGDTAVYNYFTANGTNEKSVTYNFNDVIPQSGNITPQPTTPPSPTTVGPTSTTLACDLASDSDVCCGLREYNAVIANFNQNTAVGDFNADGRVTLVDYNIVIGQFNQCRN